ncbi:Mtc1 family protein OS=Streptomyces alboniger OX=132473 GN=CP975_09550 PE=4 SV=1 [Streptomyces alboniger]
MAAWTWRFEKADGTEVQPAVQPEEFTTQGDAESWVGEYWKALSDGGADQATLFEDTTKISPMSLHADAAEAYRGGAGLAGGHAQGRRP